MNVNEKGKPESKHVVKDMNDVYYSTRLIKPNGNFITNRTYDSKIKINRPDLSEECISYIHDKVKEIIKNYQRKLYDKSDKNLVDLISSIIPLSENYKNVASNTKLFYLMSKYFSKLEDDEKIGHLKLTSHYIYTRGSYRLKSIKDVQEYLLRVYTLNSISDGLEDILKLMELTQKKLTKYSANYLLVYYIKHKLEKDAVILIKDILDDPKLYGLPMITFENTLKLLSLSDDVETLKIGAAFFNIAKNPSEELIKLNSDIHSKLEQEHIQI